MSQGFMASGGLIAALVLALLVIITIAKTAVVVPQQSAYVVERLGKYSSTLGAGFHLLVPFLDVIRYGILSRKMRWTFRSRFASPATMSKSPSTASFT